MARADDHEAGLAVFIAAQRRARFSAALASGGNTRAEETSRLSNSADLVASLCRAAPPARSVEEFVRKLAVEIRAETEALRIYLVSGSWQLDGRIVDLEQGLRLAAWADAGTLLSVVPGRLAIYVGEGINHTLILESGLSEPPLAF